jgi:hypothetical protein
MVYRERLKLRRDRSVTPTLLFSISTLCLPLCACGDSPPSPPQNQETAMMDEDRALLKDIGRAGPEIARRLIKSVSVQDGLVIVRDPLTAGFFTYVLPASSPWIVSCGVGLSVIFGSAVSGDGSSVGNEVEVRLVTAPVDQNACAVLAPQLGKRLKAMLQDPHSP